MTNKSLRRGFDILLAGKATEEIVELSYPKQVAVFPIDYIGKTKLLVAEGDSVIAGEPVCSFKTHENIVLTAPSSGKVSKIVRGDRRRLDAIIIDTDGKNEGKKFNVAVSTKDAILNVLLESGLFASITQRPFGTVAHPEELPRDIFISGIESAPLAPSLRLILQGKEKEFQKGIEILAKLTDGSVHLSIHKDDNKVPDVLKNVQQAEIHRFKGPHPVGNVGVQIHHIAPIKGRHDIVWTANVQSVIRIGGLFLHGKLQTETVIACAGTGFRENKRKYYKTYQGAIISEIITPEENVRYISGNVLTGNKINDYMFIGNFDNLITAIPEPTKNEIMGWALPGFGKLSKSYTFIGSLIQKFKKLSETADYHGGHRAFVATGIYKDVLPMDIYPLHLIKSIMIQDFEDMEGLGIYEVIEEDLALCEYVDPSKNEFQEILRSGLDLIEKEG